MRTLQAAQVVYGNVEAGRSPQGRGGFQTLFRSSSHLTEHEVTQEIEPRLFFDSRGAPQTKHVFFRISNDRVVLAQVTSLTTTDEYGRTGLYIGHALVFVAEDFLKLGNNPFPIFNAFTFFDSVDQATSAGATEQGDIPPALVQLAEHEGHREYDGLSREQLSHLCMFANESLRSSVPASPIGFYGEANKILDILRDSFLLIPAQLRLGCSFDTRFIGGTFGKTPYFFLGFPADEPRDRRFACFDVEECEFTPPVVLQSPTSYDLWLKWMLRPPLSDIANSVDDAVRITALLDGRQPRGDQRATANTDSLLAFRPILEMRLRAQLKDQMGEALSDRILPQVFTWARQQGLEIIGPLTQGFSDDQVEGWVSGAYERYYEKPTTSELEHLERLSSKNQKSFLRLIYLRWNQQWPDLRTALDSVEISVSNRFKRWALATVSAFARPIANPEQGLSLGLCFGAADPQSSDTFGLIAALLDVSPEPLLDALTNRPADPLVDLARPEQMQHLKPNSIKHLLSLLELLVNRIDERA